MFLRCKVRRKDGKQHRYWSVVENTRVGGGRVVQRPLGTEHLSGYRDEHCSAIPPGSDAAEERDAVRATIDRIAGW
jgi:hypothetical protein